MKDLEREKMLALQYNNDNFEAVITLSEKVREDLAWWKNLTSTNNPIRSYKYQIEIFSDASQGIETRKIAKTILII